jgi:hypothetical protein
MLLCGSSGSDDIFSRKMKMVLQTIMRQNALENAELNYKCKTSGMF